MGFLKLLTLKEVVYGTCFTPLPLGFKFTLLAHYLDNIKTLISKI
jgi:hypothetical protein